MSHGRLLGQEPEGEARQGQPRPSVESQHQRAEREHRDQGILAEGRVVDGLGGDGMDGEQQPGHDGPPPVALRQKAARERHDQPARADVPGEVRELEHRRAHRDQGVEHVGERAERPPRPLEAAGEVPAREQRPERARL